MRRRETFQVLIPIVAATGMVACAARQPLPDDGFVDVPGGRVIPEAGHSVQSDQAAAFNAVVAEFIDHIEKR
jgi:pimeloyl-ACP methyl ester carboxylesterase